MKNIFLVFWVICLLALPACAAQDVIEVDSAEAFVEAIASGVTIRIKPGRYDLTEAAGKGSSPAVTWEEVYDGMQLNITGVRDLTIEGSGAANTEIVVTPMYADVIAFADCENIAIKGLTMGHVETGDCSGNVLTFTNVKGVTLDDVDLYGCGVIGIEMRGVSGLKVTRSVIRDCSWNMMEMTDVSSASFVDTRFRHSSGMIYGGGKISDITFERCTFEQKKLWGEEGPWPTIDFLRWGESEAKNVKVVNSVVVTEDDPIAIEDLFFGVETENVTIKAADVSHDALCGPDGYSRDYHREMEQPETRTDQYEAIGREHDRQEKWTNEYVARLREGMSADRADMLDKAQAAWEKWRGLDVEFLASIAFGDADMTSWYRSLDERVRRTVFMRALASEPEERGSWKFEPEARDPRPARDKMTRDGEGYSARFTKAVEKWSGNTADLLEIIQAEVELQDKWLNELYKDLRAKLNDEQKTALRDAQRAWLAWRDADGELIYDPDGGSMARIDANDDFLDKLVRRVAFFEDLIERY